MTKSIIVTMFFAALGAGLAQAEDAAEKATDYRDALMTVYAWNVTSLGDMVKGKVPFDTLLFARHARDLAAATQLEFLAGFPEGSGEDSDASETIWLDWATFQDKHRALREQAAKLAEVAAGGDEAAMKAQFGATAKTCKGCHESFKN